VNRPSLATTPAAAYVGLPHHQVMMMLLLLLLLARVRGIK